MRPGAGAAALPVGTPLAVLRAPPEPAEPADGDDVAHCHVGAAEEAEDDDATARAAAPDDKDDEGGDDEGEDEGGEVPQDDLRLAALDRGRH